MPISDKKDNELSDYQFHCRYCILYGMKMDEAADLWNDNIKNKYSNRDEHINLLFSIFSQQGKEYHPQDDTTLVKEYIKEGEIYLAEVTKRKRDRALVRHRLEKDNYECQNCGFPIYVKSERPLNSILVEIHHLNPIQDGERETKIEDLISLCPNCHKLIHAIGKELNADILSIDLLKKYIFQQAAGVST
jgi:predicted HNH restriction endonuclease